eukprot:Opistho-2@96621
MAVDGAAGPGSPPATASASASAVTGADGKPHPELKIDISRIPCARDAYLNGIVSGTIAGVVRFFMTWNGIKGGNAAVFTFAGVSIVSWHFCRYQRERNARLLKEGLEKMNQAAKRPPPAGAVGGEDNPR